MNWYVKQQVYCLQNGEGVVIQINTNELFPVVVKFKSGYQNYTFDGRYENQDLTPMLYPAKPEIILPKWQPKPGEWCWFWDEGTNGVLLAKFTNITEGKLYRSHGGSVWKYCAPFIGELPEHLKEVEK
jgi:hypothetical protein